MISAVDTNILLDILIPNTKYAGLSKALLDDACQRGSLIINGMVYSELCSQFPSKGELDRFLTETGIRLVASTQDALYAAGLAWKEYCAKGGTKIRLCPRCGAKLQWRCLDCGETVPLRQHILSDFMIGGFALKQAGRLLTRDRGYYRTYFKELKIVNPEPFK